MKKTLCKSTLALAVAVASTGALAGTLGLDAPYSTPSDIIPTLAEEIFGPGSEETLITVPDFTYTIGGDSEIDQGDTATVKITLGGVAVFGEDLSDIEDWADSDLTLVFNFDQPYSLDVGASPTPFSDPEFDIDVSSGGAIGDNTIVFEITNLTGGASTIGNVDLDSVNFGYFKIKNLTSILMPPVNGRVNLVTEYQNLDEGGQPLDTADPIDILTSDYAWVVDLEGETGYGCGLNPDGGDKRGMISSASGSLLFTGETDFGDGNDNDGCQAAGDFFAGDDTAVLTLGEFDVDLNDEILKEDLTEFQLNGGDMFEFTVSSNRSLAGYGSIFLTDGDDFDGCDGPLSDRLFSTSGASAVISGSGLNSSDFDDGFHLCLEADGSTVIPRADVFAIDLSYVDYFNIRYIDSMYNGIVFGGLEDNGCTVTLFNVPNPNSGDTAFIRLTNITENIGGMVTADMWAEDGTPMPGDELTPLTPYLAAHATGIYTSDPSAPGSSVYLGDHVPMFDTSGGRSRIVLRGAFPTCEAMGLVRSPNGTLTNMTSTTYNGFDAWYGGDTNGTSNTAE